MSHGDKVKNLPLLSEIADNDLFIMSDVSMDRTGRILASTVRDQLNGANVYMIDPNVTDQGLSVTGSIKAAMDDVGVTTRATLFFRHTGDSAYTDYTVTTAIDMSSYPNIDLFCANGARLIGNGNKTLYSPSVIMAGSRQQIFSGSGTVVFSRPGRIPAKWFASSTACAASAPRGSEILISGDYDVAAYGVFSFSVPVHIVGDGGWSRDNTPDQYGPRIINSGGDVVDSPVITFSAASAEYGASIRNLPIIHEGTSSYAIASSNIVYLLIDNVDIECNALGDGGITLTNASHFFKAHKSKIRNFTVRGISITGIGSEYIITDCHIATTEDNAVCIYTTAEGTSVIGGAVSANGTNGIGVHFYNTSASATYQGGLVQRIFAENMETADSVIKIDGSTYAFMHVTVRDIRCSLSEVANIINFQRASKCILDNPIVIAPTGGGNVATWGENSSYCVIKGNYDMGRSPVSVHASATRAEKIVEGIREYDSDHSNITTDANLYVTVQDYIEFGQSAHHNGTAWDIGKVSLTDNEATGITVPGEYGQVEIQVLATPTACGIVSYRASAGASAEELLTAGADLETATGVLEGTTGSDAKLTISPHTDGKVYIENRLGVTKAVFYRFKTIIN